MKFQKLFLALTLLSLQSMASAHCPASIKEEDVCLMLKQNTIFIYSHEMGHNGPYKDFAKSELKNIKNDKSDLPFKKVARGIYRLDTPEIQKSLTAFIYLDKKTTEIKLQQE